MELSVITVTRNRPQILVEKLASLAAQTLPPDRFELVVCVNSCEQGSLELLRGAATPFATTVLSFAANEGVAKARNACVGAAKGQLLYFSDDDCLLLPQTLLAHLEAHRRFGRCVVVGPLKLPEPLREKARKEPFEEVLAWGSRALWINATGANTSMPARAFRSIGGYDESFATYGGEDPNLALRLRALGLPFRFAPQALAYHAGRQLADNYRDKAFSAGRAHWRVYRQFPSLEVGLLLGVHPLLLTLKRLLFNERIAPYTKDPRYAYEKAYLAGALEEKAHEG